MLSKFPTINFIPQLFWSANKSNFKCGQDFFLSPSQYRSLFRNHLSFKKVPTSTWCRLFKKILYFQYNRVWANRYDADDAKMATDLLNTYLTWASKVNKKHLYHFFRKAVLFLSLFLVVDYSLWWCLIPNDQLINQLIITRSTSWNMYSINLIFTLKNLRLSRSQAN